MLSRGTGTGGREPGPRTASLRAASEIVMVCAPSGIATAASRFQSGLCCAAHAIAAAFPLSRPAARPVRRRPSLEIEFCGVRCVNPFFLSSSPVGNTAEMIARAFDAGWGGAVYKTLNRERDFEVVDPTPRLNALHNGAERFVGDRAAELGRSS